MNERIAELYEQARLSAKSIDADIDPKGWMDLYHQKFAELIVRECGQVLVDNTPIVNQVEDWDKGYDRAMNDCIHHIYEHFGVES